MTETTNVLDEFNALAAAHMKKEVAEAVIKARALVEAVKTRSQSESKGRALEKLLLKSWRCMPKTLVNLVHGGLRQPLNVAMVSIDPTRTKYWVSGGFLYERYRFGNPPPPPKDPADLQDVYAAHVPDEDIPAILDVIAAVREQDLSSHYFIPQDTAVVECDCLPSDKISKEPTWNRSLSYEMYAANLEQAVIRFRNYRRTLKGVAKIRSVIVRLPGLDHIVSLEINKEGLPVAPSEAILQDT